MSVISRRNQYIKLQIINVFTLTPVQRLSSKISLLLRYHQFKVLLTMDFKCNPFSTNYHNDSNYSSHGSSNYNNGQIYHLPKQHWTNPYRGNFNVCFNSNRCIVIVVHHIKYTVFYQKFGFPYLLNIRIVCIRTCSDTPVPTYKYPLWVILVRYVLSL